MGNQLNKSFKNIGGSDPLDFLASRILSKIDAEKTQRTTVKVFISRFFALASFVAILPVIFNVFNQFQNSGFGNYLALFFTDTNIAVMYWKDLLLSLIESVPMFEMTILLVLLLVLSISIKYSNVDNRKVILLEKLV